MDIFTASEETLNRLLNKRIKALNPEVSWEEVCHDDATKLLFSWYESKSSDFTLRKILRSLNYAAYNAVKDGADSILPYHMSMGIKDSL